MTAGLMEHFLYIAAKGLVISVLTLAAYYLARGRSPELRSALLTAGLVALLLLPAAHFLLPAIDPGLPALGNPTQAEPGGAAVEGGDDIGTFFERRFNPFFQETDAADPVRQPKSFALLSLWKEIIWLGGVLVVLALYLLRTASIWILLNWTKPLQDRDLNRRLQDAAASLGLKGPVRVYTSDLASVPMIVGLVRQTLVLPPAFADWPDDMQRTVLLHELAHVRRNDNSMDVVAQLSCALFWFNPLVWWMKHKLHEEREIACDSLVIENGVPQTAYARHLTSIATSQVPVQRQILLPTTFVRRSALTQRIKAILKPIRSGSSLLFRSSAALLILLAAMVTAALKPVPDPTPESIPAMADLKDTDMDRAAKLLPAFSELPWFKPGSSDLYYPTLQKLLQEFVEQPLDYRSRPGSPSLERLIAIAGNTRAATFARKEAVRWIGAHGSEKAAVFLLDLLRSDRSEEVLEEAVESFAEMTLGSYTKEFSQLLTSRAQPRAKLEVAWYLLQTDPFPALDFIEQQLFTIINEDLNEDALRMLNRVLLPRSRDIIERAAGEHPLEDVRRTAHRLLKRSD